MTARNEMTINKKKGSKVKTKQKGSERRIGNRTTNKIITVEGKATE